MEEDTDFLSEEEVAIKEEPSGELVIEDYVLNTSDVPESLSSTLHCDDLTSMYIKSEPQSTSDDELDKRKNRGTRKRSRSKLKDRRAAGSASKQVSEGQAYFLRSLANAEATEELTRTAQRGAERPPRKRTLEEDDFEHEVLSVLRANCSQKDPSSQDPDEMFLLSQLPLIRKFSLADKADFQIKVIQLLRSYTLHPT